MPTSDYHTKDGKRVPGVTTILNRFKDSGGLIYWAWQQGKEGKDFRETRDTAAEAGTLAHSMVFNHLKGELVLPPLLLDKTQERAYKAFQNYLSFEKQSNVKIIALETPMVSEQHRYGGTPDALMEIDGKLALGDWKTSNGVYEDMLLQLGGYAILWEENHPEQPITGGFHLCRFAKEAGDYSHHYWDTLDEAKEMFLLLRRAYELDKLLKKRV